MKSKAARSRTSKLIKAGRSVRPHQLLSNGDVSPPPPGANGGVSNGAQTAQPITSTTSVSGEVTEEKSGLPLAGVRVTWTMDIASAKRNGHRRIELGSAVTDDDGNFLITAENNPTTQTVLCCARHADKKNTKSYLSMFDRNKKLLGRPFTVTAETREIVLHPPTTGKKASRRQWKALANYLTTNRMMLVRDVAQQLSTPAPRQPGRRLNGAATRIGLAHHARRLGRTKTEALSAANRPSLSKPGFRGTGALSAGNVGRAVKHFNDDANVAKLVSDIDHVFPWVRDTDRSLYRDYLRGVWVAAAQKMYVDIARRRQAGGTVWSNSSTSASSRISTRTTSDAAGCEAAGALLTAS